MKKAAIMLAFLFVFSASAYAQMGAPKVETDMMDNEDEEMKPQGMPEGMMPMMPMCRQMMSGQNMIMQEMMHMMTDMMKMQRRIIKGVTSDKKKDLMDEMDKMMEKMDEMMSEMRVMSMKGMMGPETMEPKKEEKGVPKKEEAPPAQHKH